MATFRVGQRVKVIGAQVTPETNGKEGTVLGWTSDAQRGDLRWSGYCVALDGMDNSHPHTKSRYVFFPEHLTPLYDGHSKVSWSECLWQPNKETA